MLCCSGANEDSTHDGKQQTSTEPAAHHVHNQPPSSATANALDVPAPVDSSEAPKAVGPAEHTGAASWA